MREAFTFKPAEFVPFTDRKVLDRVRNISREDMEKHPNPEFKIRIVPDVNSIWVGDMFSRIKESDEKDKKIVIILPNPAPGTYTAVAELINRFQISCRNVYVFNMDEWADDQGNVAPETYTAGLKYSVMKYLYSRINEDLRMPRDHIVGPTTETISDYSQMIADCGNGGADICYSATGWAGHTAFIEPNSTFVCDSIEEFLQMGSRIVTQHPLSIAENSQLGLFGMSGDVASIPPCGATIGPLDIVRARNRFEMHQLTTMGTYATWQRMISRLALYGPVNLQVAASIMQLMPTSVYVSELIAAPINCLETMVY